MRPKQFLYIDPLKQGLKRGITDGAYAGNGNVFIHRSIKTRIETSYIIIIISQTEMFLYIDPLKQGLKLITLIAVMVHYLSFYT